MQNNNFKKKFWISVSIIIVTIVVASVALYFLAGQIQANANAIGMARTQTATDDAEFQDLANLQRDSVVAASYQAIMDKLLSSQASVITFPTQVDSLGRDNSVSTNFSFEGSATPATPTVPGNSPFSLDVSGPMTNIISFMKDFESSTPILLSSLDTVSVVGSNSNYTLTAKGSVYFK